MTRTMKKFTGFVLMVCMIVSLFAGVTTAFAAKDFKDVPSDNWAKTYVDYVVDKGYFAGATTDLFKPDDNMTRGMFVAVIAKVEGLTLDNNVAVDFSDVQTGKYYAGAVKWATDNGIVSGYGNGKFGPNDAITREQICVMMDKYIQYHDANNDTKYMDRKASVDFKDASDISSWAKDSVQKCVSYGLVQGFPDGKFYPKRNATRAEVSVMIYRLALWKEVVDGDEYKVSYKYESGTEGVELPAALNILIVPDSRTFHTGDIAEAYDPALSSFVADGKQWKFEGYKEKTVTVADSDVEFVGVWVVAKEAQKEYGVKYAFADIDGKNIVPIDVPKDEKTYKTGEKVSAMNPDSPVKTEKGVWTFVGWDKEGAQTMTETVADHDVVFTGYWKYTANKYHVTYVAKMYGTGEALPAEVAKELEGRAPVDKNEYEDGAWVWIKEPTSKSDYSDPTGRVWNYKGATYQVATTIKGADIEVVEYWGYAGPKYTLTYTSSIEDVDGEGMSNVDIRNTLLTALPNPRTESHYAGEYVTVKWPTQTVSKADTRFLIIPKYDLDGEWMFKYYKNSYSGETYMPGGNEELRMPARSISLVAYWKYYEYAKVHYNNITKNKSVDKTKLDALLPKPNSTKDRVIPGDTITIQEPSKKSITINKVEYKYYGAAVNSTDPKDVVKDKNFDITEDVYNDSNGKIEIYWLWYAKDTKAFYVNNPSGNSKLDNMLPDPNPEDDVYAPGDSITISEPENKTVKIGSKVYSYVGATINKPVNSKKTNLIKGNTYTLKPEDINNSNEVVVYWNWKDTQNKVYYRFANESSLPEDVMKQLEIEEESLANYAESDTVYPSWSPKQTEVHEEGKTWYWNGWDKYYVINDNNEVTFTGNWTTSPKNYVSYKFVSTRPQDALTDVLKVNSIPETRTNLDKAGQKIKLPSITVPSNGEWKFVGWTTNPNATKPVYKQPGDEVEIKETTEYVGVWQKIK